MFLWIFLRQFNAKIMPLYYISVFNIIASLKNNIYKILYTLAQFDIVLSYLV